MIKRTLLIAAVASVASALLVAGAGPAIAHKGKHRYCKAGVGCVSWRAHGDRLAVRDTRRNGWAVKVIATGRGFDIECWDTTGAGGRASRCPSPEIPDRRRISFRICNADHSEGIVADCWNAGSART